MGPIAVDVVAQPPPSDLQTQTLTASCTEAARPVRCTLAGSEATEGAVRAIVTFDDGYARVRVEALVPVTQPDGRSATRVAIREAVFRDSDPVLERFRAAGLIVAGFVADLAPRPPPVHILPAPRPSIVPSDEAPAIASIASDHDPVETPPPGSVATPPAATTEEPPLAPRPPRPPVALSVAGIATSPTDRPRIGASLDGDFSLGASPVFITTHAGYVQTARSDVLGISTLAGTLGVGAGVQARIPWTPVWVRARARVEVEAMRVAIDQPGTNQRDAVSVHPLAGLGGDAELVWTMSPLVGVFADVGIDWTDDEVDVSVGGKPSEVLLPWSGRVGIGATFWLP